MECCAYRWFLTMLLTVAGLNASSQNSFVFAPELFLQGESGFIVGFSPDGKQLYYVKENPATKKMGLYQASRLANRWGNEALLPFSGIHNDVSARITSSGKKIVFTSDRPGGSANPNDPWNLWVVEKNISGWTEPLPIQEINNRGMECCGVPLTDQLIAFSADRGKDSSWWISWFDISSKQESYMDNVNSRTTWQWPSFFVDSKTLLLSSMGRTEGKGQDDLYISFKVKSAWSTPIHLGELVNTEAYEDGPVLTPDKKYLIYNQHTTPDSRSIIKAIRWKPVYKKAKSQLAKKNK